jgi:hypothetical protein
MFAARTTRIVHHFPKFEHVTDILWKEQKKQFFIM